MTHAVRRFHVGDRLSEMAIHHGTVYLAGQVPDDTTQDIRGQTRQVLAMVDKLLAEAHTDNAHILMAQIFLADMADFAGMNEVYAKFFTADFPARSTIQVAARPKGAQVEIEVIAHF